MLLSFLILLIRSSIHIPIHSPIHVPSTPPFTFYSHPMPTADYVIRPIATDHVTCEPTHIPTDWSLVNTIIKKNYEPVGSEWSLTDYLRRLKNHGEQCNTLRIEYRRKPERGSGVVTKEECDRAVAKGGLSAGDTRREVRAGVWGDTMHDFDQCTSHQSLILCALNADPETNVVAEFPCLYRYVHHKTEERQRVADAHFGGDVQAAKHLYQVLTFGGKARDPYDEPISDAKLTGFAREMADFKARVHDANPSFHADLKRKTAAKNRSAIRASGLTEAEARAKGIGCKDWVASLMSLWCRNKESEVIEAVAGWCIESGLIRNRAFDNSKDGLMVPKADVRAYLDQNDSEHATVADLCAQFEEVGADVTGYRVRWDEKPMGDAKVAFWEKMDGLTVPLPQQPADGSGLKFDRQYVRDLPTPEARLAYFSDHFAFIDDQAKVVFIQAVDINHPDGSTERKRDIVWYSAKDLVTTFGNIESGLKNGINQPIPLPVAWLSDPDRRNYAKISASPYPDVHNPARAEYYSEDVFNTFVGYPEIPWKDARDDEYAEEEMTKIIDPFMQLTSHLVGCQCYDPANGRFPPMDEYPPDDRAKLEVVLMLAGIRIAHPDRDREPYAILIQGMQGTGKNTFTEVLASLVGRAHYKCSSDIEDFCGTHAEGLLNKLVAVFNEADIGSTAKHANKMKGLVSEDTATVNPKNIRPYDYTVSALFIALSNESCPIRIDVNNGDRRWIVVRSNDWCPKMWSRHMWAKLHQRFKEPVFLRALRQYFCTRDYGSYDFRTAKLANARSPAYQALVQYFVPGEARFLQYHIENQHYNPGSQFTGSDDDTPFYSNSQWNTPVSASASDLFAASKTFFEYTNTSGAVAEKSLQSFNNKLCALGPMTKTTEKRKVVWVFTPRRVYEALVEKGFVSEECLDAETRAALAADGEGGVAAKVLSAADVGFDW